MVRELSAENRITSFIHCGQCLKELPAGVSPKEWAQLEAGFTKEGIQIRCKRHGLNVVHIDFEGKQHPANMMPKDI